MRWFLGAVISGIAGSLTTAFLSSAPDLVASVSSGIPDWLNLGGLRAAENGVVDRQGNFVPIPTALWYSVGFLSFSIFSAYVFLTEVGGKSSNKFTVILFPGMFILFGLIGIEMFAVALEAAGDGPLPFRFH